MTEEPMEARRILFDASCDALERLAAGLLNSGMPPIDCLAVFGEATADLAINLMGRDEAARFLHLAAEKVARLEQPRAH